MVKCFISGVEIQLDSAYILDREAVIAHLRHLRRQMLILDGLLNNYGQQDVRKTVAGKQRHWRLVTRVVADALTDSFPEKNLFITWPQYKTKKLVQLLKTKGANSVYRQYLVHLRDEDFTRVATLGRDVLKILERKERLPRPILLAVLAGVCVEYCDSEPKEIARLVRSAIKGDSGVLEQMTGSGELAIKAIAKYYTQCNQCNTGEEKSC